MTLFADPRRWFAPQTDATGTREKLLALQRFVLLYGVARSVAYLKWAEESTPLLFVAVLAAVAAAVLGFREKFSVLAPRVALPAALYTAWHGFPNTPNHMFLELYTLTLLSLIDTRSKRDDGLVLQGLCWLTVLVLFHTGLQKALHGYYFRGDFLAFMIATQERFSRVFAWLLSTEEITRLQGYDPMRTGAGPFRVDKPLFVAVSNLVWLAEMLLPLLIIWKRTRVWAVGAALLLVLAIQLGALEVGFALLFGNLLLFMLPKNWNRRLLPISSVILFVALLGIVVGTTWGRAVNL